MYAFIQGTVEDVEQDRVSVNCGGVGYEILTTNTAIGKCAVGQAAKLLGLMAENVQMIMGIPLSVSQKSPYFDRKFQK